MIRRRLLLAIPGLLAAPALLIAGCGGKEPPPPKPPPVLGLAIAAGADQNPDPSGRPNPVAVRLFQLNGTAKFERADVFALIEREQQTLGSEGQGSEEFVVRPGETVTITRELKPGVQFIGVAVLFRDIDHATWRAVAPVAASGLSKRSLAITGLRAALAST